MQALGLALPPAAAAAANYRPTARAGNLLFVSGQLPWCSDGSLITGRLGETVSLLDGQRAARLAALNVLAQALAALGTLDRVAGVVKLTGYVAATAEFREPHLVLNGASDLLTEVFGEKGKHARAAVGVASLPLASAVEVEAILDIRD